MSVATRPPRRWMSVAPEPLRQSVAFLLALTVLQRGVGFLRDMAFCRWLDRTDLGQFDMAYGFLLMAAPLIVLGLPGSFGRYVEYFRTRGQLRQFVVRVTAAVSLLTVLATCAVWRWPRAFSTLIFGSPDHPELMALVAIGIVAVVLFNSLISLYTALRLYRVASTMQFAMSILFAAVGVALVVIWRPSTASLLVALVFACMLASLGSFGWLREVWRGLPHESEFTTQRVFWSRLMPFAMSMWAANLLTNMFDMADRYLIVHASGVGSSAALAIVGEYRASRIVPVLFVGIAELLSATITPHLAADWEANHRERVVSRLNFIIKLSLVVLFFACVAIVLGSPLLFNVGFAGKYPLGLAVLPWTLVYCAWRAVAIVSNNYLWCAEKAHLASVSLAVGLGANVALNLWLLPKYGLPGAVAATTLANLTNLLILLGITGQLGMRWDRGIFVLIAALPCVAFGWIGLGIGCAIVAAAMAWGHVFQQQDWRDLRNILGRKDHRDALAAEPSSVGIDS